MKIIITILAIGFITPVVFTSCNSTAGNVAAGAVTYKAIDNHREQERREDAVKVRSVQNRR